MLAWTWQKTAVFCVPFVLVGIALAAMVLLRKTLRTRARTAAHLRDDPDINEWLVVFGWSRKILYIP
jgi:hypothetical protein